MAPTIFFSKKMNFISVNIFVYFAKLFEKVISKIHLTPAPSPFMKMERGGC
jgi:hypothetical protein